MSEQPVLECGLIENYKDVVRHFGSWFGGNFKYISPFVAYNKDDLDMMYVFGNEQQLKEFLEQVWYDDNYSDHDDMENSMSEWFVWKFIDEEDVKRWPTLYPNAILTKITCDNLKVFRVRYEIKIEPCIYVNINRKQ
jgi:hypothetical protein